MRRPSSKNESIQWVKTQTKSEADAIQQKLAEAAAIDSEATLPYSEAGRVIKLSRLLNGVTEEPEPQIAEIVEAVKPPETGQTQVSEAEVESIPANNIDVLSDPDLATEIMKKLMVAGDTSEKEKDRVEEEFFAAYPASADSIKAISRSIRVIINELELYHQKQHLAGHRLNAIELKKLNRRIDRSYGLLARYTNQITEFVISHRGNQAGLENFWKVFDNAYKQKYRDDIATPLMETKRKGILSQAAVIEAFDELGLEPRIAKSQEDAEFNIDLWAKGNLVFQLKNFNGSEPMIFGRGEEIDAVREHYQAPAGTAPKITDFLKNGRAKMVNYGYKIKQDLHPFLILVPYSMFDNVTGEPLPQLIEFFRQKFRLADYPDYAN